MSSRAGHPVAAKAPGQGRGLRPASLRYAPGKPLTASFPGKIGTYREDGAVSVERHTSPHFRRIELASFKAFSATSFCVIDVLATSAADAFSLFT